MKKKQVLFLIAASCILLAVFAFLLTQTKNEPHFPQIERETVYDVLGNVERERVFSYDENGRITQMLYYYKADTEPTVYCWEYDHSGRPNRCMHFVTTLSEQPDYVLEYKYNLFGQLAEVRKHMETGVLFCRTRFVFDFRGRIISILEQHPTEVEDQRWDYSFDKNGRKTAETNFRWNGTVKEYKTYEYNPDGQLLHEWIFDSSSQEPSRFDYKYDTVGRRIERIYYDSDGVCCSRTVYSYRDDAKK